MNYNFPINVGCRTEGVRGALYSIDNIAFDYAIHDQFRLENDFQSMNCVCKEQNV